MSREGSVWTDEQLADLLRMWEQGMKKAELARMHGVSPERMRQLIYRAVVRLKSREPA
jgi:DNA-binding CsgD family transcriptional regulator